MSRPTGVVIQHEAFLQRLGMGINLAPHVYTQMDKSEWRALRDTVGHVRLAGDIATPLIDWKTCRHRLDADNLTLIDGVRSHSGLITLRTGVKDALAHNLTVVLDPLHVLPNELPLSYQMISLLWRVLLETFSSEEFPCDRVAFELVNEPGNSKQASLEPETWYDMLPALVSAIRREQPSRILLVGPAQGFVAVKRGEYISAWTAASLGAARLVNITNHFGGIINTFHYYWPREFTNFGRNKAGSLSLRTDGSATDSSRWGSDSEVLEMGRSFDILHRAYQGASLYVGEFGVNVDLCDRQSALVWLQALRTAVLRRGFAAAVWTYLDSGSKALTNATAPNQRLCQWFGSEHVDVIFGRDTGKASLGEACSPIWQWKGICDTFTPASENCSAQVAKPKRVYSLAQCVSICAGCGKDACRYVSYSLHHRTCRVYLTCEAGVWMKRYYDYVTATTSPVGEYGFSPICTEGKRLEGPRIVHPIEGCNRWRCRN